MNRNTGNFQSANSHDQAKNDLDNIQVQIQSQANQSLDSTRRMVQMMAEVIMSLFKI